MFNIGIFELLIIFIWILIGFHPSKLPALLITCRRYVMNIKSYIVTLQNTINSEIYKLEADGYEHLVSSSASTATKKNIKDEKSIGNQKEN